ncbi:MAG TPA: MarR family transcriptional regulator [Thermoanaerobaculia bacterium]|nr:MarR family transcriptional regulator [Thermoanaerobaculia bacterium]
MTKTQLTKKLMDDFRRIVQALRSTHRAATKANLTGAQLFVLNTLGQSKEPMSITSVAEQTRTDPSTVSVVVARLVRKGLVHRTRSGDDGRRNELTLTPRGIRLERSVPATVAQQGLARALDKLDREEAEMLSSILQRICADMGCAETEPAMMFETAVRKRTRA